MNRIYILFLLLIISILSFTACAKENLKKESYPIICKNPDFKGISKNLPAEKVSKILGKPWKKNGHAWIYSRQGWGGTFEIYFDENNKVTDKDCGYG